MSPGAEPPEGEAGQGRAEGAGTARVRGPGRLTTPAVPTRPSPLKRAPRTGAANPTTVKTQCQGAEGQGPASRPTPCAPDGGRAEWPACSSATSAAQLRAVRESLSEVAPTRFQERGRRAGQKKGGFLSQTCPLLVPF